MNVPRPRLGFAAWLALGLAGLGVSGCTESEEGRDSEIPGLVAEFLPLERRAIALREARFALADSLRFATADLQAATDPHRRTELEHRLRAMEGRRELLVSESLALADTVRAALVVILEEKLRDRQDRRAFQDQLQAELAAAGPD